MSGSAGQIAIVYCTFHREARCGTFGDLLSVGCTNARVRYHLLQKNPLDTAPKQFTHEPHAGKCSVPSLACRRPGAIIHLFRALNRKLLRLSNLIHS